MIVRLRMRRVNSGPWGGLASWIAVSVLGVAYAEAPPAPGGGPAPDVVGEPAEIAFESPSVELQGPRAFQQLLVTGRYADGEVRDLTRSVEYSVAEAGVAGVDAKGVVRPTGDGETQVVARVAGREASCAVSVRGFEQPSPVHFHHEVIAALTRSGCNSGACHGTPSGKNGFRLSLQGYLPDQDYLVLTREFYGRRIDLLAPDASLILQKGAARTPHEGGRRFGPDQEAYRVVRGWIAEGGAAPPADGPQLVRLEVVPKRRVLRNDARNQQIVVVAEFSDGARRDVTALTAFSSSDPSVADVSKTGLATFQERGSVAVLCRYLHLVENAKLSYLKDVPNFAWTDPPANNYVDEHVFAKLKELQILPSDLCSDAEFVRRVHLDAAGVLPSRERVEAFLADQDPEKRAKLIDEVLERREYADLWALKWADVLRSTRKLVAYRGAHNFRRYLVDVFSRNVPMDRFATELLTSSGDTMMRPEANYYRVARDPQECAEATAQLFLGVRMQCAKCHNHPFERWTQDDYYGLAACFARVGRKAPAPQGEREIVFAARTGEVNHLRTGQVMPPKAPGEPPFEADSEDRRTLLAQWLTAAGNPFFAKSVVNRIWFHLLGKGIVDPVDDFRDSNPPRNEELLDALADDFVKSGYDFKGVVRTILNSRTYQLSARPNEFNETDEKYFSRAYPKLLPAEVLLDAVSSATGSPEKFPGLPLGTRAVELPDGEIGHEFLQAFGQPSRELVCECARESETTLTQALNLINGDVVHAKLRDPNNRVHQMLASGADDDAIVQALYLTTMSRPPVDAEIQAVKAHLAKIGDRTKAFEDVQWALINSKEFLFRH